MKDCETWQEVALLLFLMLLLSLLLLMLLLLLLLSLLSSVLVVVVVVVVVGVVGCSLSIVNDRQQTTCYQLKFFGNRCSSHFNLES